MIIVDDGSDDSTPDIIKEFTDSRIKLITQKNQGIWNLAETYNRALRESTGEYIAILEGDDTWPSDKLDVQISRMNQESVVMSYGKCLRMDSEGSIPILPRLSNNSFRYSGYTIEPKNEVIEEFLIDGNFIQPVTVMIRRDSLVSIGGFHQPDYVPYVDYPTFLKLFKQGDIMEISHVLGYHRHHGQQVTQQQINQITSAANRYAVEFYDTLDQEIRNELDICRGDLLENREGTPDQRVGAGRINLLSGKWVDARREFWRGILEGDQYFKFVSLLGLIHSYLHMDMEWLAKATNKRWFAQTEDEPPQSEKN